MIDTIKGTIGSTVSFHYDVGSDVLYLRRVEHLRTPTIGEMMDDGIIEDRTEDTDELVGLTVVSWWKRIGSGEPPDSLAAIARNVEPLASRVAAVVG